MKVTKDKAQKIGLAVVGFFGLLYVYFDQLINPAQAGVLATAQASKDMIPKINAAKELIDRVKKLEEKGPSSKALIDQVNGMIPDGSPVAWFPSRMNSFFKRQHFPEFAPNGIEKVTVRQSSEIADIKGFRKITWALDMPKIQFMLFAAVIANLENEEPLIEVSSIIMDVNRDSFTEQKATVTIISLVKQ